jgi:hypothetical protein
MCPAPRTESRVWTVGREVAVVGLRKAAAAGLRTRLQVTPASHRSHGPPLLTIGMVGADASSLPLPTMTHGAFRASEACVSMACLVRRARQRPPLQDGVSPAAAVDEAG